MEKGRNAQYGAATGIVAVILILVGFFITFSSDVPKLDDPAQEWANFFVDHQDRIQFGITIVGVGLFFYIWFLGSLRDAIAAAEGGTGRLASIAYGGGLVSVGFFLLALTGTASAAFHPGEVDPTITRALSDIGVLAVAPAAAAFTAVFAATAVAGYRHGTFPAPVAGLSALAAITQPLAYGVALTDSGAFAGDGAIGFWVPLVTFVVALLALSGSLVSRTGEGAGAGGAAAQ
jgi:hypothetical protein